MNVDHEDTSSVSNNIKNPSIVIESDGTYSALGWTTQGSIRSDKKWTRGAALSSLLEKMLTLGAEYNAPYAGKPK